MDSTLSAHATPTSSLPLGSLIPPPPPAQAPDAARASRVPALYERLASDTLPTLPAATASNGSAPEMLPADGCPIFAMPSDVLHAIVIELRKADSTLHGLREVERLRATCGQLRDMIPRPIPEGLLGAVEFNDMAALKQLLAVLGQDSKILQQELQRGGQLMKHRDPRVEKQICDPMSAAILLDRAAMVIALLKVAPEFRVGELGSIPPDILMCAAVLGATETAEALITAGAAIDCVSPDGYTLLQMAIAGGNDKMVRMVIRAGAAADHAFPNGMVPLPLAAALGHADVIGVLLDESAKVDQREKDGRTALMVAYITGHESAAQILRLAGAKDFPIFAQWIKTALKNNIDRFFLQFSMLTIATMSGDMELVTDLLAAGADVNQISYHVDDRKRCECVALMVAAKNGYPQIVLTLLRAGAMLYPPIKPGARILHLAAQSGNADTVRILLQAGMDIDELDGDGHNYNETALHKAAIENHCVVADLLLQAGAKVNKGRALMTAAYYGHVATTRLLIRYAANVNDTTWQGDSLFYIFVTMGNYRGVKTLLEGGANPVFKDGDEMTKLAYAVKNLHNEAADLLRGLQ